MRRTAAIALATCVVAAVITGCDSGASTSPPTSTTAKTTKPPEVAEHESGPESPLTYGMQVPTGATQLGPLVRYRSARLISAYEPELKAAEAQRKVEEQDRIADAQQKAAEDGETFTPPPPTTTPDPRPSDDSFRLLDEQPRPDTTVSLMRVDGKPSDVVRRMIAQIGAALPDSEPDTNDLSEYCRSKDRRITGCTLAVRGLTLDERDIRITMTVDPGNLKTRTSPPSALTRPVMSLMIEYVGEPRRGQLERETGELGDVVDVDKTPETSGLVWPSMDEDAAGTTELVNGWTAPTTATILLSGFDPKFVATTTLRAADGDQIAEQFALANGADGEFDKDVVEDLNEVSTTYTATAKDGSIARATYILTARGNYTMLFYSPEPN